LFGQRDQGVLGTILKIPSSTKREEGIFKKKLFSASLQIATFEYRNWGKLSEAKLNSEPNDYTSFNEFQNKKIK
jgi:hypothetical protein